MQGEGNVYRGLALSIIILFSFCSHSLAAPKSRLLDEHWLRHDPASNVIVDHSVWDTFLKIYISASPEGINLISYSRIKGEDKDALNAYINRLSGSKVTELNRSEQKAFWVNLYNALTVKVILDHYPLKSIRDIDISPGFFSSGPWGAKLLTVEGRKISLNDIEHGILRPIWKDPRVHYAVNCASIGCPNLRARAYTAGNMEEMLEAGAGEYINHPRGATVKDGRLIVSSIYTWFQEDFDGSDEGVLRHLRAYSGKALSEGLRGINRISDNDYDWSINDKGN